MEKKYELITSNSGFERHIIPVSELKIINDINSRNPESIKITNPDDFFDKVKSPEQRDMLDVLKGIEKALIGIQKVIYNKKIK